MRWKKKAPVHGEERIKCGFVFFKTIGDETRCLEYSSWTERFYVNLDVGRRTASWKAIRWNPDLPLSGHGTPPKVHPPPKKTAKPQKTASVPVQKSGKARIRKGARVGRDRHFFDFEEEDVVFSVVVENPESSFGCTCRAPGYGAMVKYGFDPEEKYGSGALHANVNDLVWIEADKQE